jgi:hypothetical protein
MLQEVHINGMVRRMRWAVTNGTTVRTLKMEV